MMKRLVKALIRSAGYEVVNLERPTNRDLFPADFDEAVIKTYLKVRPFTLTSPERVFVLLRAIEYLHANNVAGDIVECGVWKGGSMMAVAETLSRLGSHERHLYGFDTFKGWEAVPGPVESDGIFANRVWQERQVADPSRAEYSLDEVQRRLEATEYPRDKIHLVVGKVEDTLPSQAPAAIALLRLDTDFYESTRHEMQHLFPRLARGGVLIIDDYGNGGYEGARRAVDEYIAHERLPLLLNRIDSDGRIAVKM
jgi:hypothetical protein